MYRAQRGVDTKPIQDNRGRLRVERPMGFSLDRMKPLADRAIQGRANPSGIPVLYLAGSIETAISEVRPWIGSHVSVAKVEITRDIRIVDLSSGTPSHTDIARDLMYPPRDPTQKEQRVWSSIESAFSEPVTASDDKADYVPTQILSEFFRSSGFDAIRYRSQFGEGGQNLALFNLKDAEVVYCSPYEVTSIAVKFWEIPWGGEIGSPRFPVTRGYFVMFPNEDDADPSGSDPADH